MEKLNQLSGRAVPVDLIRTVAIVGVILLHASGEWTVTAQQMNRRNPFEIIRWSTVRYLPKFSANWVAAIHNVNGRAFASTHKR
jgi:hypothetical protein